MSLNQLKEKYNGVVCTYGYLTKGKRIELEIPKSHTNDAFVIAGGERQKRCRPLFVKQNRRNNRCLQLNRKGFKPSIRKQRYKYQPGDLVKIVNKTYKVKGVFNYGKWVRLVSDDGKILNAAMHKVTLLKFNRGFAFEH